MSNPIIDELHRYITELVEKDGSDLHIKTQSDVRIRVRGDVLPLGTEVMDEEKVTEMARHLSGNNFEKFERDQEYDTVYIYNDEYRFRVNLYYHLGGIAIALRLIPYEIKTMEALNLPKELMQLTDLNRGLVLVTGTTGSGKSTTLATVIEEINKKHRKHVITIEDPVEFVHTDKIGIIEQRGIGQHTKTFSDALRAAMREDPDIIVVGEMRDVETVESALQAVNSGHLVFSTLHTLDARETIDRLIAMFPAREQNRVRMHLASNLQAVISQRLLRTKEDKLVPAVEMMFRSPRIEGLIRELRDDEIPDAMEDERNIFGSKTFNMALFDLCLNDTISEEEAFKYATSPSDLKLMLTKSSAYNEKLRRESGEDIDFAEIKE